MAASRKRKNPASRKRKGKSNAIGLLTPALRLWTSPLESLVFLLPFILLYELGCLVLQARSAGAFDHERLVAFHLLQVFFQLFGSTWVWMPGLAVIIILLCTHAASGKPWTINKRTVGLMYVESAMLAVPLLVFNMVLRATLLTAANESSVGSEVVLGIGAGIYEELVFRLMLISVLSMIGTDLAGLPQRGTLVVSVVIAAVAFSVHHHPPLGSEPFDAATFAFRTLAGLYLGVIFVLRGYGPAAGTHALYNVLVTVWV